MSNDDPRPKDEGGLHAPPGLSFWRWLWWWFDFWILVKLARLRFLAILLLIGLVIVKWDLILAYYDKWTRPASAAHATGAEVEYYCPMHPAVVRERPGEKCPICFMPLSRRKKGDATDEALPAGIVNRVQLTPYRVVLAGIRTWKVSYQPLIKEITTVGFVDFNEREMKQVAARVKGRIDKLYVNETGQIVQAGAVLASLYSPDLVATVQNLMDAQAGSDLFRSARERLKLWGIDEQEVKELLASRKANTHLKIRSPITGHVLKKYVKEGQYVEEGSPLYDIVDISTVWIQAQIYEDDLAFLPSQIHQHKGSKQDLSGLAVTATTQAFPNQVFEGRLTFVYPHVDQATRTLTARFELNNPDEKLPPGITATVKFKVPPKDVDLFTKSWSEDWMQRFAVEAMVPANSQGVAALVQAAQERVLLERGLVLAVPDTSVIDTGALKIVYREIAPGEYEGVKVELGPRMLGPQGVPFYPVLRGLEAGDLVVTAGSFLVDAETRLNPAAGSIYFGGSGSGGPKGVTGNSAVRPSTPEDEEAKTSAALGKLSAADRRLAVAQEFCVVLTNNRLGSMGVPIKLIVQDQPVFLCCQGCDKGALANPKRTLTTVERLQRAKAASTPP